MAGTVEKNGYTVIKLAGKTYKAHRLAWLHVYGRWPVDQIDHINRVRTDNRLCNLREASRSENQINTRRLVNRTSGVTGVKLHKRKRMRFEARITVRGKRLYLGLFERLEDAQQAYSVARTLHFKAFAKNEEQTKTANEIANTVASERAKYWSGREDLNPRPSAPKAGENDPSG